MLCRLVGTQYGTCSSLIRTWHDSHASISLPQQSALQWSHKEADGVSNYQPHDRILNRLFRRRSKKTSKLHVTGLCKGNSPVTGEFPAKRASKAENVSIWWRHHETAVEGKCFHDCQGMLWLLPCNFNWAEMKYWSKSNYGRRKNLGWIQPYTRFIITLLNSRLIIGLRPANERRH